MVDQKADAISWDEVWPLIQELWPRWQPNSRQEELWFNRLRTYPNALVVSAIKQVAAEKSNYTPRLSWVLSALNVSFASYTAGRGRKSPAHAENLRARFDKQDPSKATLFRGMAYSELLGLELDILSAASARFYGADTDQHRDYVKRLQRHVDHKARVESRPGGVHERQEVEEGNVMMAEQLATLAPAALKHYRDRVNDCGFFDEIKGLDIEEWGNWNRAAVWARWQNDEAEDLTEGDRSHEVRIEYHEPAIT